MITLFEGQDYAERCWLVQADIGEDGRISVSFKASKGSKVRLNQRTVWFNGAWDLSEEWIPKTPAPVPDFILRNVVDELKKLETPTN